MLDFHSVGCLMIPQKSCFLVGISVIHMVSIGAGTRVGADHWDIESALLIALGWCPKGRNVPCQSVLVYISKLYHGQVSNAIYSFRVRLPFHACNMITRLRRCVVMLSLNRITIKVLNTGSSEVPPICPFRRTSFSLPSTCHLVEVFH